MHWIQRHILRRLSSSDTARYSELRPKDVEGNLFMYHLQQLIQAGYVEKQPTGYRLMAQGKIHVSQMSLRKGVPIKQPNALVMIAYRHNGQYLLYRWTRQPYRGRVSLPFGRLHSGWTVTDMAAAQLRDKTGVPATDFRVRGSVGVQVRDGGEVAQHYVAHVVEVTGSGGTIVQDDVTGEAFWGTPAEIADTDTVPGFREVLALLAAPEPLFFAEITITS